MRHYSLRGEKIQAGNANENGDVEKSHDNFKTAVNQALMLRASRDFESREEYARFLRQILAQLNSGRQKRFVEELKVLRQLPLRRLRNFKRFDVRVRSSSTIRVQKNVYSVNSRLIGEKVRVYLHADELELWYGQKHIATIPRLCGEGKHRISYRDVIDSLVRKPGAFENYQYREDLFPSHRFRVAYDLLKANSPKKASRIYLEILHLAAKESETGVENALKALLDRGDSITLEAVKELLNGQNKPSYRQEGRVEEVDLKSYDELLQSGEAAA